MTRDCPHGVQYRKRMHLCAPCMEPVIDRLIDVMEVVAAPLAINGEDHAAAVKHARAVLKEVSSTMVEGSTRPVEPEGK
jgi:hypothetical protein